MESTPSIYIKTENLYGNLYTEGGEESSFRLWAFSETEREAVILEHEIVN